MDEASEMELPGSGYLYALATISVTFVGFSSLVLVFRQTIGRATTHYDSYFVLAFMQVGFIVAGGCLLPPLLALFGLAESMVWRAASGVASLPILLFVATVPRRRRGAVGEPAPLFVRLLLLLQLLMGLYLLANAIAVYFAPAAGNYAAVMAGMLFTSGIAYLMALDIALRDPMPPRQ
jgi:hypothetical protein